MLENINFAAFKEPIISNLINNLTKETCSILANILALDYVARLNSIPIINEYSIECMRKVKTFLGPKVITDDSFATAMMLFAVAISPEQINYQDKNNVLNQGQTQDSIIDALINEHFKDSDADDRKRIKGVLKDLLSQGAGYKMLNQINSNPKLITSIITHALKQYGKQIEINNHVKIEIDKVMDKTVKLDKKMNFLSEAACKIITASCALALGALSIATAGVALSILIVPASILTVKYVPKLANKIGKAIISLDSSIMEEQDDIQIFKTHFIKNTEEALREIEKSNEKNVQQTLNVASVNNPKFNEIKGQLLPHINISANEEVVKMSYDISKSKEGGRGK